MSEQITDFKCPSCTGPLSFSAVSGLLECEYCDSKFTTSYIEDLYKTKTEDAEAAFQKEAEKQSDTTQQSEWDCSGISDDWGAEGGNISAYTCSSCGAELLCESTTAATSCPYCGNNAIVPGQFSGILKPDYVLPFKLDKKLAISALKKHYKGKWLLPREFSDANHIEKIQGVYVPFWLYNAQVDASCNFQGQNTHTHRSGNYEITETDYYNVHRSGTVDFTYVPVDGSAKMDDSYMDSLEPFDYTKMVPFSTVYFPGFLADRYDQSAEECAERADSRCINSAISAMRADVKGYQSVTTSSSHTNINRGKVHYALLPVWVLHTKWQDKNYLFMMNGQTGKLVGDLPADNRKFWLSTVIGAVLFAFILYITKIAPFLAGILVEMIMGA